MKRLQSERGVALPLITKGLAGAAVVVALVQAVGEPSTPAATFEIEAWELVKWLIVGLVALVFWFVRRTFNEHERRICDLETAHDTAMDKLQTLVTSLDRSVLALSLMCPLCKIDRLKPPEDGT